MADDGAGGSAGRRAGTAALQEIMAAEHAAIWGYGVVGAVLPPATRPEAVAAEEAHRDMRERVARMLDARKVDPVAANAAYALPFPVLSAHDAAVLAVRLEDGVARAWARLLDQATDRDARALAVEGLSATEVRAVGWRASAGQTPVTTPFPGLPQQ